MKMVYVDIVEIPTSLGVLRVKYEGKLPVNPDTGNALLTGALIKKANDYILALLAEKEAIFTARELMFIFSVLPFTQVEIANAMGKEKSTLTHYKSGKNVPDILFCSTLQDIIVDHLNGSQETMTRLLEMVNGRPEDEVLARLKKPVSLKRRLVIG